MATPGSGSYGGLSEAQRNAIVEALLAQQYQQQQITPSAFMGESAASNPNDWPTDPSDPDAQSPGYATMSDLGLGTPVSPSPGMPGLTQAENNAVSINAANNPDANTGPLGGNLTSPSPGLSSALAAPVGTPAGFYAGLPGFTSPDNDVAAAPATPAQPDAYAQGLTFGGRTIAGHNIAPAFDAFEGAPVAPSPNSVVAGRFGAMQAPSASPAGFDQGAAIAADIAGLSALNADVNASVNAAYGSPAAVTGAPATAAQAAQATTGTPATAAPDVAVGYGIGLGLGDSVGGGFGGATGDGTSGGQGAEAGGPGVGGASTGISGGPGGTGEGGANTGEGGTGVGTSGAGEGGGGDGGAGK